MEHVRRITFQKDAAGKSNDIVQLTDKSVVRGRVTAEQFVVDRDGGGEVTLKKADVREITVNRATCRSRGPRSCSGCSRSRRWRSSSASTTSSSWRSSWAGCPRNSSRAAGKIGLGAALGTRIALLFSLSFLLSLTAPIFTLPALPLLHDLDAREVSWRDIILFGGGSVPDRQERLRDPREAGGGEGEHEGSSQPMGRPAGAGQAVASFAWTIVTIAVIDIVFSLDSVITAVGMVEHVWVMVIAMVIAMLVMLYFAGPIGRLRREAPDDQGAGAELPHPDRRDAGGRGAGTAHRQGLHLRRDGLRGRGRDDQHAAAPAEEKERREGNLPRRSSQGGITAHY